MSSGQGVGFRQSTEDESEEGFLSGLLRILGFAVVLVVGLVVVIFLFNTIFIDLIILRNPDPLKKKLREIRRIFMPWWHPRTEPDNDDGTTDEENGTQNENEENLDDSNNRDLELVTINGLLEGLKRRQKEEIIESMLNVKVCVIRHITYCVDSLI